MAPNKRARVENSGIRINDNYINGEFVAPRSGEYKDVTNPATNEVCARYAVSNAQDVQDAVDAARKAFEDWGTWTVKRRAAVLYKFHQLMEEHSEELIQLIVEENGKNRTEAAGDVAKGNESVEWGCSLPQTSQGKFLEVSRGVTCHDQRDPLGVIGTVCPFNFPAMVPLWSSPICLAAGNCVILKPSEKVPSTATRIAELLTEAGVPPGVFQIVSGEGTAVQSLCDNEGVDAMTFVGSSKIAESVAQRCRAINKRVLALGGAKNHLVALPDCDRDMAAQDIVASFAGCTGQRCMAASVLLVVGEQPELMNKLVEKAGSFTAGQQPGQIGPVIDPASYKKIKKYIDDAEASGSKILLDGRGWGDKFSKGNWIGPTIILCNSEKDPAMTDEIFGPVLSVLQVPTNERAIEIENANPYGNAASVYTSIGANADWFTRRFSASMLGVNIGIPVPREPFSFGGMNRSKFGDFDITGDGQLEFCTRRRKITTKWVRPDPSMQVKDSANFDGAM
eukprot:gb/GECG01016819.1/.p1 GENE.gb/GECG01016819.1/~~gb/GECG01016819.1/.p1  ORF type:complete len:508 (+),score=56.06 gb/GECG01016819.1/:1-1524(+)